MTTPTGTPDWLKAIPGGAQPALILSSFTVPGVFTSPAFDTTKYNGLYLTANFASASTVFAIFEVEYFDGPALSNQVAAFTAVVAGNSRLRVNVPVLGPFARISVIVNGSVNLVCTQLVAIGHNGGGSASYRPVSVVLAEVVNQFISAGASLQVNATTVSEGPGQFLVLAGGTQPAIINVWAYDSVGTTHLIARRSTLTSGNAETIPLWIPPLPTMIEIANAGSASSNYYATLVLGRS